MAKLLVTGGSGHLGRTVIDRLLESTPAHDILTTTRSPAKLAGLGLDVRTSSFDDDVDAQARAYEGADHLLVISTDALGRRVEQHTRAFEAAKRAGVTHVSYTSLTRCEPGNPIALAPEHWGSEQALAASGLPYTILRNNWYAEYLVPGLQLAVQHGRLFGATGGRAFAPITREDCARAAALALRRGGTGARTLEISGAEALTFAELARLAGERTGKTIESVELAGDAFEAALAERVPPPLAHLLRTFHDAIAAGVMAPKSDTEAWLDAPVQRFAAFLTTDMLTTPA